MRLITLLLLMSQTSLAAEPATAPLVGTMRQAMQSDGFEVRMNVSTVKADSSLTPPVKLSVTGKFGAAGQRLLIRGISPDAVRNRHVAAERNANGKIRAIEYRAADTHKTEPYARLFGTGLVIWDMFGAWWDWPRQEIAGHDKIAGRPCTLIRSQTDNGNIREVISCVDQEAQLSLRTQLFDRSHTLLRTLTVQQLMRKESGAMAAKKLSITEADQTVSQLEVYGGDEHYLVTSGTFDRLDQSGGE